MTYPNVRKVVNGESVSAAVDGRPIDDLTERTDHIKGQVDRLSFLSSRLILPDQSVGDAVLDSNVVFLDEADDKWDLAIANVEFVPDSTIASLGEGAFAQGIAKNITGSIGNRRADVYIYGLVDNVNVTNLVDTAQSFKNEPYWLSLDNAGKLTKTKPTLAQVFMGKFVTLTNFLFTPVLGEALKNVLSHDHIVKKLNNAVWVEITPGEFLYPAAEFEVFPPNPIQLSVLEINGVEQEYDDTYFIDGDGLHYVPDFPEYEPDPDPDVFSSLLKYIQVSASGSNVVTSIAPGNDSVNIKSSVSGDDAITGDLVIDFNFAIEEEANQNKDVTVKDVRVNPQSGALIKTTGPYVQSIEAGSGIDVQSSGANFTISSTANLFGEGLILQDLVLQGARSELSVDGVTSYISFPQDITEPSLTAKFYYGGDPKDLTVYLFGFGDAVGNANLQITRSVSKLGQSVFGASSVFDIAIPITTNYTRYELFTIPAADLEKDCVVKFTVTRKNPDALSGKVGVTFFKVE